jgi:TonB family protein
MRSPLLISLVCLGACHPRAYVPPSEPVDPRPWCERIDYDWVTPREPKPSAPPPSVALLGFASIDKDIIRRVIIANKWATERCYELALEHDPNLEGRVVVSFVIDADGTIGAVEVVDDTLEDPCVGRCVVEVGKRLWHWPPRGSGTITITYPFLFTRP